MADTFKHLQNITRRHFLFESATGLGALAAGALLGGCSSPKPSAMTSLNPMKPRAPHFPGKAKSVIYLHMAGAPSQLELFDYKPVLAKLHNQKCPPSLLEGKQFAFIRGVPNMLGPQARFQQRGQSGAWISDYLPHLSSVADELSFLKAVHTDQFNHAPAQLLMHTGAPRLGRPSIGAWATYGLGTENQNLPGFVVLTSGGKTPDAGKSVWGSGFLPSVYQGVQCRSEGDPILFLSDPHGVSRELKHETISAINAINNKTFKDFNDPETLTRMHQYELAYRMQISVPEVMNINSEPQAIHELYGTQPGKTSFANNCLLARKLVEQGVRFVQLFDWGWDSHGTDVDNAIDIGLRNKCREIDRPITALILDLKQRGLLDQTLIVWGGEFGRTPMQENRDNADMPFLGRDHHADAFTMFMVGGGITPGITWGETDEIGYAPVQGKTSIQDVHATILNQLGMNHEQLTYQFQGRPFRLTDVSGNVISAIAS
jgi:hypothetical protein